MPIQDAERDNNYVQTLLGVDMTTGLLPTKVYVDEATNRLLTSTTVTSYATGKTIKTVTGTVSTDTDIVAAVSTKRIKVFAISLLSSSSTINTITMQSNASTALWTTPIQAISGTVMGVNLAVDPPAFLFATTAGQKLTLDVSAAQNVTYSVSYWDDDTT